MARYDKYAPKGGGFRAGIGFAAVLADLNVPFGVGLDANGRAVKGSGTTGVIGVLIVTKTKAIGDIVDVMTAGDIVEAGAGAAGTTALAAGIPVYAVPGTGLLTATSTGNVRVGWTVEGGVVATTRLVVRAGVPNPLTAA